MHTHRRARQNGCSGCTLAPACHTVRLCVCVHIRVSVCEYTQRELRERQHSRVLKQLRALIRLQAEISLDDKNTGTGLEGGASRAAGGGIGSRPGLLEVRWFF